MEWQQQLKAIEYDPNRTARIALVVYNDGEKRYIIAPNGLKVGQTIMSGKDVLLLKLEIHYSFQIFL